MAAAESVHSHPTQTEAATCSICVVAHSSKASVDTAPSAPILATVGVVHEKDIVAKARLEFSDAGIRGPPAVL